jgi:hypothetical protein
MIYPVSPVTEFFCWFFMNGCCNATLTNWQCGIPPLLYFLIGLFAIVLLYHVLKRGLGERKGESSVPSPLGSEQSQKKEAKA